MVKNLLAYYPYKRIDHRLMINLKQILLWVDVALEAEPQDFRSLAGAKEREIERLKLQFC